VLPRRRSRARRRPGYLPTSGLSTSRASQLSTTRIPNRKLGAVSDHAIALPFLMSPSNAAAMLKFPAAFKSQLEAPMPRRSPAAFAHEPRRSREGPVQRPCGRLGLGPPASVLVADTQPRSITPTGFARETERSATLEFGPRGGMSRASKIRVRCRCLRSELAELLAMQLLSGLGVYLVLVA